MPCTSSFTVWSRTSLGIRFKWSLCQRLRWRLEVKPPPCLSPSGSGVMWGLCTSPRRMTGVLIRLTVWLPSYVSVLNKLNDHSRQVTWSDRTWILSNHTRCRVDTQYPHACTLFHGWRSWREKIIKRAMILIDSDLQAIVVCVCVSQCVGTE